MLAGCALGILGAGPPDVTVYDLPEQPAFEEGTLKSDLHEGTLHYRLKGEPEGAEPDVGVTFSPGAWLAFSARFREILARFRANQCALLAVNGETDPRCEPRK